MSIEAMKRALEALEGINDEDRDKDFLNLKQFVRLDMAVEALRTAIQQAEAQQPASPGPVDWPLRARVWKRESTQEWVLEIEGTLGDTDMNIRHTQPLSVGYENVPGLHTFYTRLAPSVPDDVVRDAERYRWLKEKGAYEPPRFNDADGYSEFRVFFWTRSKTLDAAIDAAKKEPS